MLNCRRLFEDGLYRILGIADVVEGEFDIRVIERPLEHLTVDLEEGRPRRFGFLQGLAYRFLEQAVVDGTVDPAQEAQLPFRTGQAAFLRKPDVQLSSRQRKCPGVRFHYVIPHTMS
ncbi:hypothetical protein MCHIJ_12030 [Mycolicibacterium chitae]|nr:hypothetical protein MCHIJ_12030 [Mycolicibacterium chitae]